MPFSPASTSPISVFTVLNGSAAKAAPAKAATAIGTRTKSFMVVSHRCATFESRLCQDTGACRIIPSAVEKILGRGPLSFPYAGFAPSQSKPDLSRA